MKTSFLHVTAVICLWLLYSTESCNVEVVATVNSTNITSPGYPNQVYPNNLTCWWRVVAANSDHSVMVEIVDSVIESSTNCTKDSLSFYDGFNTTAPRLGTVCGTQKEMYISSVSAMFIQFQTDSSRGSKGFLLKVYDTPKCGGNLTATSVLSTVLSPGYPNQYFNNMQCEWTITAENQDDTVEIEFIQSNIEESWPCVDYVTVYNGNVTYVNESLGKFCGSQTPRFQSSEDQLKVVFITNRFVVKKGFSMNYRSVEADHCNKTLLAGTHPLYFVSPGYPDGVYRDMVCVWTIQTQNTTEYVHLRAISSDIEYSEDCDNASVTIYSGYENIQLGSFCGNSTPDYMTNSSTITVVFKTGNTTQGKGFRIGYIAYVKKEPFRCGGNLMAGVNGKTLTQPENPGYFIVNLKCVWTIYTNYTNIKVDVQWSNMEQYCAWDHVQVNDGCTNSSPVIGKFCGTNTPTYYSSGQYVNITYYSQSNFRKTQGFRLVYTGGRFAPCGEQDRVTHILGDDHIMSPNYPYHYPSNADCSWRIDSGSSDSVVSIRVFSSNIVNSSGCTADYVEAFDGYDNSSSSLGRWCGTDRPSKVSSGRYMFIEFHTDGSDTATGFKLSYEAKRKEKHNSHVGEIVGGTLGGIVVLICVICVVTYAWINSERLRNSVRRGKKDTEWDVANRM